jgi:hypothetical protein
MSRQVRVVVVIIMVLATTFVVGYGVAAQFVHPNLVPAGTTRYGFAGAMDAQTTTSTTFVNIPNLSQPFMVPSGKVADLSVQFSGELNGCSAISVRALLDGSTVFAPGEVQVFWPFAGSGAASHGFTFFKVAVPAGSHTVVLQWHELTNCNQAFISLRSLVLTANIH